MRNNIIILELLKRQKCKVEAYNEIGLEIKHRRERRGLTLEQVAGEICSVSYLSKIENSLIVANHFYLHELCKRVNLTDEEIDKLFSIEKYVEEALDAF